MRSRTIRSADVNLHCVEQGDGPLVVLSHGFPELAFSWRHQLPALSASGYRVIAPDQRGYGRTSQPDSVEDYDIHHLTADLIAVLDTLGEERAVFVGHDWGSMVVSHVALMHPERGGPRRAGRPPRRRARRRRRPLGPTEQPQAVNSHLIAFLDDIHRRTP